MDPGLLLMKVYHLKSQSERTFVMDSEREELRNSTEEALQQRPPQNTVKRVFVSA